MRPAGLTLRKEKPPSAPVVNLPRRFISACAGSWFSYRPTGEDCQTSTSAPATGLPHLDDRAVLEAEHLGRPAGEPQPAGRVEQDDDRATVTVRELESGDERTIQATLVRHEHRERHAVEIQLDAGGTARAVGRAAGRLAKSPVNPGGVVAVQARVTTTISDIRLAIRLGTEGGRLAFRAGRIPRRLYAQAKQKRGEHLPENLQHLLTVSASQEITSLLERMRDEAAQTEERCEQLAGEIDGKKTTIQEKARETKQEAEQMMKDYLGDDADGLDGLEFLIMAEAGELGHWEVLRTLNERAREEAVAKLTEFTEGLQSYIVFIVRDDRRADFLFQCSDNTWQAYNRWPENESLYTHPDGAHAPGVAVSDATVARGERSEQVRGHVGSPGV